MPSVFGRIKVWRKYELSYKVRTAKLDVSGNRERDSFTGNFLFNEEPKTVMIYMKPSYEGVNNPRLSARIGTDDKAITVKGRSIDPIQFPEELKTGEKVEVTIDGEPGSFEFIKGLPSVITVIDEKLGEKFSGIWRPTNA